MERVTPYNCMYDIPLNFMQKIDQLVFDIQFNPDKVEYFLKSNKNVKFTNFANKFKESGLTQDEICDILYDVGFDNMGEDVNGEIVILDYGLQL
jgi:hypothetical protein